MSVESEHEDVAPADIADGIDACLRILGIVIPLDIRLLKPCNGNNMILSKISSINEEKSN